MDEWAHTIGREEYELLIDGLCRATAIAVGIEEMAEKLDTETIKEMARAMQDRIGECIQFGMFDEDDVRSINKAALASMYTRGDA